jgi:mono/diheme cytochrome c family protein
MTQPVSTSVVLSAALAGLVATLTFFPSGLSAQAPAGPPPSLQRQVLDRYCAACHNEKLKTAGLNLVQADMSKPGAYPELWEKVVRKVRTGVMPPANMAQPSEAERLTLLTFLETTLDAASAARPNPGRTETLRRLNRTEYQNAIRDLLALDIDAASLLPADESGHGFDNVTVGDLSPTLLNRYISAAQKISRLAMGSAQSSVQSDTVSVAADLTQEDQLPGMPMGTRGGVSTLHTFAQDGDYDVQIMLARNLEGVVSGLRERRTHQLLVLIDREPVKTFTVQRTANGDDTKADRDLKVRLPITAGPHTVSVTFVQEGSSLIDTLRQPTESRFNDRRHPRSVPAVDQLSITGPYGPRGAGDTPSRRRLLICRPTGQAAEDAQCAASILSAVMRRAYRRPVAKADVENPMVFYRRARASGDFDAGITAALSAILANPEFLLRVESDPRKMPAGGVDRISGLELASRLSFFLWSSIPDDELLEAAIRGKLSQPAELEKHVRRLLDDRRSLNLATNFAGQWLRLRNIDAVSPNANLFRDFDDNLRQALRRETEMFFDSVVREDRSVLTFIRSDYTFLNERLAKHYGIPGVYGSRFRRVALTPESKRGGLLRQGSVLSVTSYATRTSPVLRGVLVLSNMLGAPPPSPPPDVPALDESTMSANLSMRQRLAVHRDNAVCASCHRSIDPVGFALENFDAIGQWRDSEADGKAIDASGSVPGGGGEFRGVEGLEHAFLAQPDRFVTALTENLMTFALGRGVEYYDAPAVRKIVKNAEKDGYRFSSLILGIVKSAPFQMRRAESREDPAPSKTASRK